LGKGVKGIFAVWEDTRGDDIDIHFGQTYKTTAPELDINSIKGPIGITASIKNTGDAEATNIEWTLKISGGIFGLIHKIINGSQDMLEINEELYAKSGIIVGLGKLFVTATVTCTEGSSNREEKQGIQIFFISFI
jgi:hypothetical protein